MSWPTPLDYHEAVQMPRVSFADPDLKDGTLAINGLGLPLVASGAFASVYRLTCAGKSWAIRCFHENRADQQHRYEEIARVPGVDELDCLVKFQYLKEGIRVHGYWFPILKMEWVDGETLDQILRKVSDPSRLHDLSSKFRRMVSTLQDTGIAHGDLQHGNIMFVKEQLKLVDYDCMFAPQLLGLQSLELGHRNYQHPCRSKTHFGSYLDNFSAWLIHLSLEALIVDPALMRVAGGGDECIIFRYGDLINPDGSPIFKAMAHHGSADVRRIAFTLRKLIKCPVELIPGIDASYDEIALLPETALESLDYESEFDLPVIGHRSERGLEATVRPLKRLQGMAGLRRTVGDASHQAWFFVMSRVSPESCVKSLLWDAELLMASDTDEALSKLNEALDLCLSNKLRKGLKAQVYMLHGYCQMRRGNMRQAEKLFDNAIKSAGPPSVVFESVLARTIVYRIMGEDSRASALLDKHFESGRLLSAVSVIRQRPVPQVAVLNAVLSSYAFWIYQNRARKEPAVQLCEVILDSYRAGGIDLASPEPFSILRLLSKAAFETHAYNVSAACIEEILQFCDDAVFPSYVLDAAIVYREGLKDDRRAMQALDALQPQQIYQVLKVDDTIYATSPAELGDLFRLKARQLEEESPHYRTSGVTASNVVREWYHLAAFVYSPVQSERQLELADCFAAAGEPHQADQILRKYRGKLGPAWESLRVRMRSFVRSMIDDAIRAGSFIEVAELVHCYRLSDTSIQDHVHALMSQAAQLSDEGNVTEALPYYTACGIFYSYDKFTYANCLNMALRAAQIYDKYKAIIAIFENPINPLKEHIPSAITRLVDELERESKRQAALDVLTTTRMAPDPERATRLLREEILALADEERVEDLLAVFERYDHESPDAGGAVCSLLLDNGRAEMASLFAKVHKIDLSKQGLTK